MNKLRNKKKSTNPHISYKYIAAFCITFAIFNFFVEKIASKNEGKNNSQIQNIRFNQVQSYKSNLVKQKFSKITIKNNPGRLLDIGGGKGVYANFMASQGWDVVMQDTLTDMSSKHNSYQFVEKLQEIDDKHKFDIITFSCNLIIRY